VYGLERDRRKKEWRGCGVLCGVVSQLFHSGCTAKHGRTIPAPLRQTRTVPMYTAPSHGVGLDCLLLLYNIHILQPTSLKGSTSLYPGLLYILGFMPPFLVFRYPSSLSRSTATCLSIIARLGPPTDCRLSTLASKSNTSWTSSPKFG
jgi:hypothetical protein